VRHAQRFDDRRYRIPVPPIESSWHTTRRPERSFGRTVGGRAAQPTTMPRFSLTDPERTLVYMVAALGLAAVTGVATFAGLAFRTRDPSELSLVLLPAPQARKAFAEPVDP
jgi:hypothetical protein